MIPITQPNLLFLLLLILIVIDIVTGIVNAVLQKEVNSTKMREGLIGKLYELAIVGLAMFLDKIFQLDCIGIATQLFYITQEGLSILENTGKYISYPQALKDVFIKLKGE